MNTNEERKRKNIGTGYSGSGVDTVTEEKALDRLLLWVNKTFAFRQQTGKAAIPIGYFASVLDIGHNIGLAISTDGVGTKLLVAQMMGKYNTVGIDCIAMNVNDVICVGAEPVSMVDYIAVEKANPEILEEIGKGLYEGAKIAGINICGGEIAQIGEMIKGVKGKYPFDIAGACVGLVALNKIIIGQDIKENDLVIGFKSSGIHSNGLTLARKVLFKNMGYSVDKYLPEIGRTIGEELLEPTRIYVKEVLDLLQSGVRVKALAHITSDGLLNLARVEAEVGYNILKLPESPPIFSLIQKCGKISDEEMFRVFNMGIGLCVVVPPEDMEKTFSIAGKYGTEAMELGYAFPDKEKRVYIEPKQLVGKGDRFYRTA